MAWLALTLILTLAAAPVAADPHAVALGRAIAEGAVLPEERTCSVLGIGWRMESA